MCLTPVELCLSEDSKTEMCHENSTGWFIIVIIECDGQLFCSGYFDRDLVRAELGCGGLGGCMEVLGELQPGHWHNTGHGQH